MRKVLVAGTTGQLGRGVLRELQQRGYAARALERDASKLAGVEVDELGLVQTDDRAVAAHQPPPPRLDEFWRRCDSG